MYAEEGQFGNTQTKGIQTLARRLRLGPLRKDILNGSGWSEDLTGNEDCEGGVWVGWWKVSTDMRA